MNNYSVKISPEIFKCRFRDVDLEFELSNEVFKSTTTTRMLVAAMSVPLDGVFIDMGCGVGYIGILAAKLGAKKVYAVDLEEGACELARKNIKRNKVETDVIVNDVPGIVGLIARSLKSYGHGKIPIVSNDGS